MNQLYLTILFPLIGFLILVSARKRLSENVAAFVGVGSVGLAALVAAYAGFDFLQHKPESGAFVLPLWTWVSIPGFTPEFNLYLDGLSLTMLGVITGVGFLIHVFASWYMRGDEDYARFFSYMNLFLASMILLVLGDNLVSLYFGWEGVGLCSYLLIGYYYRDPANGAAARKAFVVTRVGDAFMAIGLFILYQHLGTLNIQEVIAKAPTVFTVGSSAIVFATMMLLGGAVGKSAQLPLQTWLADAMAGPTPVSALIHAATMVTAGVYLIARTHVLFELAPDVLYLVGVVGAVTLFIAGFAALVQTDIKRILAYSTMSQIGYMFLALGVKAYQPAIFHLMTHAFFKALLFLSSGAVIIACHHEQNIFKMGGLRKKIPFVYACFLIGGAALVALPWVTVGFYSKDEILLEAYATSHPELFYAGLAGAFMTAIYTFRLIFVAFHGEAKTEVHALHGADYWLPLGILLVLSTGVGALIAPPLDGVLPTNPHAEEGIKHLVEIMTISTAVIGTLLATFLFLFDTKIVRSIASSSIGKVLTKFWFAAWGFDWLYDQVLVKPYVFLTRILRRDPVDKTFNLIPASITQLYRLLSATQTGSVRWYAATIAAGVVIILAALVLL
ncbi:NADH:ubiquinone oxidoreductase subunit L [Cellvibrio zantedeschiae]|uniref:NADH:ubiquinone oxidoreductase subunit L n=1 Tax=Cellvibrio zantedeschiae TaxID=1237077 RepID=A0ABQ3AYJ9_9GAMM|nr:NADH-quinone oxidoreductase subunit L [Cellvibrio zantedeschiae]GGY70873.1 NADH:ubiquinone oxidoreductase subunit L [Cellvibrio zantedeschiae]